MSGKVYVTEQYLSDIADAIRAKNGASTLYHPSEMAAAINAISTAYTLDYMWDSTDEMPTFTDSYATIKAAVLAGKTFRYTQYGDDCIGAWWNSCYFTNYTYDSVLYTECLIFYLQSDANSIYICVYGHEQGDAADSYVISAYKSMLEPSGVLNITQNGTNIDVAEYETVNVDVSGGASNFVTGTFSTGSTTGTTGTLNIPYTGAGYPLALVIVVEGGMYNSAVTPWYSAVSRYAVGQFVATKANMTTAPSYGTSGAANQGSIQVMYKSSTSSATSYSSTRSANANTYSSSDANSTATTTVRWRSNTRVSYYVSSGSNYGLLANTTYRYYAIYSE